jgi:diadenosine tetraphosphatase ApaH/serine/threonine PP2A family protein phosphatase
LGPAREPSVRTLLRPTPFHAPRFGAFAASYPGRPLTYPLTAILSDLHGNRPAVDVAIADARARGARRFVCLGDMVGYGANPRYCLDVAMALCCREPQVDAGELLPGLCLKGNHEEALLFSPDDFNPKARAAIEWTRDEVNRDAERSEAYWDFLGGLEASGVDEAAMFAHGSPREPVREYVLPRDIRDTEKMQALFEHLGQHQRPICFIGHSHVPAIYFEDGSYFLPKGTEGPFSVGDLARNRAIVNVGSVGQPRDGDARLSYVLFDGETLTFVRCEYDVEAAAEAIRAVPELPTYLAERLAVGR